MLSVNAFFCILFGLALGSFWNVLIYRLPLERFFYKRRSYCPNCEEQIPFYWNVPVISFFWLKGQCGFCKKKISFQYIFVEILTGFLFFWLYQKFPFFEDDVLDTKNFIRFIHGSMFFSILIICSFIDLKWKIIPDVISLPMILISFLWPFIHPELSHKSNLWGIFFGGGVIYAIAWIYFLLRKEEGMGMGDAKLLAGIGGWLGVESIFPTFFYASMIGSFAGFFVMIYTRKFSMKLEIPFGPFLALGATIHMAFGIKLIHWISGV